MAHIVIAVGAEIYTPANGRGGDPNRVPNALESTVEGTDFTGVVGRTKGPDQSGPDWSVTTDHQREVGGDAGKVHASPRRSLMPVMPSRRVTGPHLSGRAESDQGDFLGNLCFGLLTCLKLLYVAAYPSSFFRG